MNQEPYFSENVQNENRFILNLHHLKTEDTEKQDFEVVSGGREDCGEGYKIERDGFPYPSLEFVASGTGTLQHSGKHITLKPGSCFFYNHSMPHHIVANEGSKMRKYFLNFNGSFAQQFISSYFSHNPPIVQCRETILIIQTFDELIHYAKDPNPAGQKLCLETAKMILRKIAYHSSGEIQSHATSYHRYLDAHRMIQSSYLKLQSLKEIAAKCHLDPIYLCRLYKQYSNQTPYQHLMRCKMNHAVSLLESPRGYVKNVALELGFSDAANFSRAFKKVLGVPPSAFHRRS
jgi:AraC-like DNA-binding protein